MTSSVCKVVPVEKRQPPIAMRGGDPGYVINIQPTINAIMTTSACPRDCQLLPSPGDNSYSYLRDTESSTLIDPLMDTSGDSTGLFSRLSEGGTSSITSCYVLSNKWRGFRRWMGILRVCC